MIGKTFGHYEVTSLLGKGGMGEVYRARDTRLHRDVALKVLPESVAGDPERLARFEREARTVAGLNHPNIVVLYAVEESAGVRFLSMELVEGRSLAELLQPGGLALERVLDLGVSIADALAAAHARGIVHRDLKPANVMVTAEGRVKVLDFGLAKAPEPLETSRSATLPTPVTDAGTAVGTVPYMAPEQIRGRTVDARTDLFALGIVLYELLTGRRPFQGASPADVSSSILRDEPQPLAGLRPDLPEGVVDVVARCLRKSPPDRPRSAREVRDELARARHELASGSSVSRRHGPDPAEPADATPSVAVLPFINRSRDEEDEFFADGITEDVIAQLCKVRTLKVISRSSVMPFRDRGEQLQDIGTKLRVRHVLEGSVRRSGERLRIVAQLIEVESGEHVWAETYDRRLTDVFEIQTEVALHIAEALRATLSPGERNRIRRVPTDDVQAYELYLRGRQCVTRSTTEELQKSVAYFERALERDPDFALAHVGLAMAFTELGEFGVAGRDECAGRAIAAATRAVELDPELGEAHFARAFAQMVFRLDREEAESGLRRALELSPNSADIYNVYGRLCAGLGRHDEAIAFQERAYELDPLTHRSDLATAMIRAGRNEDAERVIRQALSVEPRDGRLHATLGWALIRQERLEEGLAELESAVRLTPGEDLWLAQLGEAYALVGRTEEALAVLRKLEDPARKTPASPYHLAYVHTGLGNVDRALDCLEQAYRAGSGPLFGLRGSFLLAPLREHPRFLALLEGIRPR